MNDKILITDTVVFDSKPDAVPYKYRTSYKMGQLCLILAICSDSSSCSFLKIQMISNALNDKRAETKLLDFCSDSNLLLASAIRFDPAVNRVLDYALADGMVKQLIKGTYKLTDKGKEFAKKIRADKDLMLKEIKFLEKIKNKLSEDKISELMDLWRFADAGNQKT